MLPFATVTATDSRCSWLAMVVIVARPTRDSLAAYQATSVDHGLAGANTGHHWSLGDGRATEADDATYTLSPC